MTIEQKLALELCKFLSHDREAIEKQLAASPDMPVVLGQLLYNRMGGVACHTLEGLDMLGRVNREFRNALKTEYDSNKAKTDSFHTMLNELCDALGGAPFKYAFLKGAYLSHVYPKGLRSSNDIDILVNGEDVTGIADILKDNGFKRGYVRGGKFASATRKDILEARMNRGETVPFVKQVSLPGMEYCEVDVNYSLDYKASQSGDAVEKLLDKAVVSRNGIPPTLSNVDFLIHLCVHLYKEAATMAWVDMGRDLSLYKFCDIYLLVNKWLNDKFSKELKYRIYELNLRNECYYALNYTRVLFGIEKDDLNNLLNWIKPVSTVYLNEIYDPKENKTYRYGVPFIEWFFSPKRKELLHDIEYDEPEEEWFTHYLMRFGREW